MKKFICLIFAFSIAGCSGQNQNVSYPDRANMLRIDGAVTIIYSVNDAGLAENVRLIKSEPTGVFEKSLMRDIRAWRFEKGKPLSNQIITINYALK